DDFEATHRACSVVEELQGVDRVETFASLLVRTGDLVEQGHGRPRLVRGPRGRRLRHDLQLGDGARPLAVGGADTVGAGVAAADDDDVLAFRGDGRSSEVAFLDPVGERQVFHGLVDAGEVAARDGQVPPHGGASGEDDGVVVGAQLVGGEVHADVDAGAE